MKEYIIKDIHGNQATILPEKGATVISFICNGTEVFYKDTENLESTERPRCGIPFLFPVFGRTPEDSIYPMGIHGFGHTSAWTVLSQKEDGLHLELTATEETKKVYPFDFCVELIFSIKEEKLHIHQIYENKGTENMPFSFGFHPYFAVSPTEVKVEIDAEVEMDMRTGKPAPCMRDMVEITFPEGAPESGAFFVQAKDEAVLHRADGKHIHIGRGNDGCHLPPELIKLAVKCKGYDKLMLVSDCGPLGGFPEGEYEADFGPMKIKVYIEDGVCKPPARNCFAGSVATSDRLVRTVYKDAGVPLWGAVRMITKTPARHCGYAGVKGEIALGADADLVTFDDDINVSAVYLMGEKVV